MPIAARFAIKRGSLPVTKLTLDTANAALTWNLATHCQKEQPSDCCLHDNDIYGRINMASSLKNCPKTGCSQDARSDQYAPLNRITINISGERFETTEQTLANFPNTLLGSPRKRAPYFDPALREYKFASNKDAFHLILFYYQSNGLLAQPVEEFLPETVFAEEVKFFQLGMAAEVQMPKKFGDDFVFRREYNTSGLRYLDELRTLLNNPKGSFKGKLLGAWITMLMVIFIAVKSVKTLPEYRGLSSDGFCCENHSTLKPDLAAERAAELGTIWFTIELICVSCFALEYLARLFSAPRRGHYAFGGLGIVDFLSCVPHFALIAVDFSAALTPEIFPLRNLLKFLPFLCILKVTRYSSGVQLFWKTLHTCNKELSLLLFCVILSVILFGSIIFYFEDGENGFISIPASFWYTIITMTTVGYGDLVAVTFGGKLFSAGCALLGVTSLLALPTTVVTNKFSTYYNAKRDAKRRRYAGAPQESRFGG